MSPDGSDLIDILVEDIMEECYDPDNYDPDEFYNCAEQFLSPYGYEGRTEAISEFKADESEEIESDHLEVISELDDEGDSIYLRFVLEDGRTGYEEPAIDTVEGPGDFVFQEGY